MKFYPPGPITRKGATALTDRLEAIITYTSHDDGIHWGLCGGLEPALGVQEGAALADGVQGLSPAFTHIDNKGAREDGVTNQRTVYEPAEYDMEIEFTVPPNHAQPELAAAAMRRVIRDWRASFDPKKPGKLLYTTPDMGVWRCTPRLFRMPPERQFRAQARRLRQKYTWTIRNDSAFWRGTDSVSTFKFNYAMARDTFNRDDTGTLGPQWSQTYTGAGSGVCETVAPFAVNAVQSVFFTGVPFPTGGFFKLSLDGYSTADIAYNANAAAVQSALEALPNIDVGDVAVTAGPAISGTPYTVTFTGGLGKRSVSQMVATHTFTGGFLPNVFAVTTTSGVDTSYGRAQWVPSGAVERTVVNRLLGVNEIQTVALTGSPTGGDWPLTFSGQTTAPIAYNATAAAVRLALEALSNIGVGDVAVSGLAGGPYTVTFTGALGLANRPVMTSTFVNEVQTVTITGSPTGGFFKLTFAGQQTADIARNATAGAVQSALEALSNIAAGDVVVTGGPGPATPYIVTFTGLLGKQNVGQMTATHTMTGGTPAIAVTTTTPGTGLTGGSAPTVTVMTNIEGTGPNTATDNQVITVAIGDAYQWPFPNTGYLDIWGRHNGNDASPTGIRARIGGGSIVLSRFNAGVETVMHTEILFISPAWWEDWTLECGTSTNPRHFKVKRGNFTRISFPEVGTGSAVGASYRGSGWGMKAGAGTIQQVPPSVDEFSVGDNVTITQSGHLTLTNFGTEDGYARFLVYGPGIFKIANGPNSTQMIEFGRLGDGQIALLTTLPRLRGVVDLSPQQPEQEFTQAEADEFTAFLNRLITFAYNNSIGILLQLWDSLFGQRPPQGPLYSLLKGRFSKPIPPKPTGEPPTPVSIPVEIVEGNADSKVIAALTPLRTWPE